MKVLSKKKVDALFDDVMTLNLMASEIIRQLVIGEKPDVKDLIRTQMIIVERSTNAACILKGMYGLLLANEIHHKYNLAKKEQLLKKEAENDKLDEIDKGE